MLAIFGWNFEIEERCKGVHCVDLGESFPTSKLYATFAFLDFLFSIFFHVPFSQSSFQIDPNSNEYLLAKFGFDTTENEPCKVCPLSAYRSPRCRPWSWPPRASRPCCSSAPSGRTPTASARQSRSRATTRSRREESTVKIKWKIRCSWKWKLNVFQNEN